MLKKTYVPLMGRFLNLSQLPKQEIENDEILICQFLFIRKIKKSGDGVIPNAVTYCLQLLTGVLVWNQWNSSNLLPAYCLRCEFKTQVTYGFWCGLSQSEKRGDFCFTFKMGIIFYYRIRDGQVLELQERVSTGEGNWMLVAQRGKLNGRDTSARGGGNNAKTLIRSIFVLHLGFQGFLFIFWVL